MNLLLGLLALSHLRLIRFPFCRLLRLAEITVKVFLPASTQGSYGNGNANHELGTGCFVNKRIVSEIKRVEFVNDRKLYIIIRGRWCHIIVLKAHA
jgi:hypothetical protein